MQNPPSTNRWPPNASATLLLLTLALLSVVVNTLSATLPERTLGHLNDAIWTGAALLTLGAVIKAWRTSAGRARSAWLLVTTGCASWVLAVLIWDYHRFVLDSYPDYPSLTDYGFLMMAPLITGGIVLFRSSSITPTFVLAQLLRIGLVFSALLIIHFLVYGALIGEKSLSNTFIITSLSYPLLYFTSVIHGATETWHRHSGRNQKTTLLLTGGMFIHAVANAEYAYTLLAVDDYSYVFVDIAWTLGFVPIFAAAVMQRNAHDRPDNPPGAIMVGVSAWIERGFLPLLLLSLSLTIFLNREQLTPELLDGFLLLVATFTVLLVGYILIVEQRERSLDRELLIRDLTFSSLVEAVPYGIQEYDLKGNITYANESMHAIVAAAPGSLLGRKFWDCAIDRGQATELQRLFARIIAETPQPESLVMQALRNDGADIWLRNDWNYRYDPDGRLVAVVCVVTDITQQKENESELRFLAQHDALTRLPNRAGLIEKVDRSIHRASRKKEQFAVFFIDLDQFKHINDSLGHAVGDQVLIAVGERITHLARTEDAVSRYSGDEFVFVVEALDQAYDASSVAERILQAFATPISVDDFQLHVTPSIGIAMYPRNGDTPETLLKNADAAMYRAKRQGRNRYAYYSEELTIAASERILYTNMLRKALECNELSLHFQPQVDIARLEIHGIEALLRWEHPDLGMVPPSTFIPVAEESGLINEIGEWVMIQAWRFQKQLRAAGKDIKVSINVSSIQFQREQFLASVEKVLGELELGDAKIEFELTESAIMNDQSQSIETLQSLSDMGISLSVDDFGTGYSSLSYLKKLPIDRIKIDRSFVRDIPGDRDDAAIARSIIALGRELNLETIAEGVETTAQLDFLRDEGCSLIQGYLFSRPLTADRLLALLERPAQLFDNLRPQAKHSEESEPLA